MKKCKFCGREFRTGYKGRKIFCSDQCGVKWWDRKYKTKYKRKHTHCVVCGYPLQKGKHLYCGDTCAKLADKQRKLERFKLFDSGRAIDMCLNCPDQDCAGVCVTELKITLFKE